MKIPVIQYEDRQINIAFVHYATYYHFHILGVTTS